MQEKLTARFQQALSDAQSLALGHNQSYIEPVHLLAALLDQENGDTASILRRAGVNVGTLRQSITRLIEDLPVIGGKHSGQMSISPELGRLLNLCDKAAQDRGDSYISSELFLLVLLDSRDRVAQAFKDAGADKIRLNQVINQLRGGEKVDDEYAEDKREALKKFTTDLTALAEQAKIDPVIGRDDEIRRTMQILQRRGKNNPVLIGEPGVGKTAIVEGLAQRIVNNEVPETLKGKRLLSLDLAALIAGTKFRGEFEERLQGVLKEIDKAGGQIILFIDEMHNVVGAGKAEGSMDAGNMLKPALARGKLHCIGATTLDEYRQYVEKDAALERRFQKVLVDEPNVEDTIAILRGLQERYEVHHGINITDPALVAAATLSHRYITDRFLPDKAIDLIDEAAAQIRIELDSKPEALDRIDRKLIQYKMERMALEKEHDDASRKRLDSLNEDIAALEKEYADLTEVWQSEKADIQDTAQIKEQMDKLKKELEASKRKSDFERMSEIQYGLLPDLQKKLEEAEKNQSKEPNRLVRHEVSADEIANIVSRWTGIPVSKMLEGERDKLLRMEDELHKRVIGQDEAVSAVANAIRRSRSGLADPNRPYGSFLFLGPTGVGKTELCKTLAAFLFDSEEQLIRVDMSEYMEKHSIARLIGAPPGYVGYEEGGYLTEQVRRKPYSVILLDEVEKAHPDVFNILLQVLDDGRLTDGQGRTVDFRNTVVVMTSNIGSQHIQALESSDYAQLKEVVMEEVKAYFRPELINRIDEVVVFHALDRENIRAIATIQLNRLRKRLAQMNLSLQISEAALDQLAENGFDPLYGARPLKRAIQNEIENPLAQSLLAGKYQPESTIHIELEGDRLVFQ